MLRQERQEKYVKIKFSWISRGGEVGGRLRIRQNSAKKNTGEGETDRATDLACTKCVVAKREGVITSTSQAITLSAKPMGRSPFSQWHTTFPGIQTEHLETRVQVHEPSTQLFLARNKIRQSKHKSVLTGEECLSDTERGSAVKITNLHAPARGGSLDPLPTPAFGRYLQD